MKNYTKNYGKNDNNDKIRSIIRRAAASATALTLLTGAARAEFADASEIANKDAVSSLVSLGILSGRPGNTFDPSGETKRSELAKMVSELLEPGAAQSGGYADAHFTDTPGTWASAYIEHCYSLGLISGNGDGTFAPNRTVTGTETAKILLAASGADASAFTGSGWAGRVNAAAETAGLYQGFAADPSAPLTRDNAALLLYNYLSFAGQKAIDTLDRNCQPQGAAAMPDGSLLLADIFSRVIWRMDGGGELTLFAGRITAPGPNGQPSGGYGDGAALGSTFRRPWAIAPFLGGWAVSDAENKALRLIKDGRVQTLNAYTGSASSPLKFAYPTGLAAGDGGCLYVSDTHNGIIWKISADGTAAKAAQNLNAPMGLCWGNGALYIAETGANRIVRLANGKVSAVAGTGEDGYADGAADQAAFSMPQGVAVGNDGAVYAADTGNGAVRRIQGGKTETFYARDESEGEALYPVSPTGVALADGKLYVTDSFAGKVIILPVN